MNYKQFKMRIRNMVFLLVAKPFGLESILLGHFKMKRNYEFTETDVHSIVWNEIGKLVRLIKCRKLKSCHHQQKQFNNWPFALTFQIKCALNVWRIICYSIRPHPRAFHGHHICSPCSSRFDFELILYFTTWLGYLTIIWFESTTKLLIFIRVRVSRNDSSIPIPYTNSKNIFSVYNSFLWAHVRLLHPCNAMITSDQLTLDTRFYHLIDWILHSEIAYIQLDWIL